MNVAFQVPRSSPCSCPAAAASVAYPALRQCRLGQASTASWQQSTAVASQPVISWFQRREMRRLGCHTASAPSVASGVPLSSQSTYLAQPACSVAVKSASRARCRSNCLVAMPRCRAVEGMAADTGLSGAGLSPSSHDRSQADVSSAQVPLQSAPSQIQTQSSDPNPDAASLLSNNGHPPITAAVDTGTQSSRFMEAASTSLAINSASSAAAERGTGTEAGSVPGEIDPADVSPFATSVDGLDDTRKFVFAEEWGFTRVGGDLPEGTTPATFSDMFPDHLFAFDPFRAAAAIAVPLAAMVAGYGWLWYMHSICPAWQQLACAALIGTAYTGLFKVAHECACFRFLPQSPGLQDALGLALMLPSLYPFTSWRLHYFEHLAQLNMLWEDTFGWHPYTKVQLATEVIVGGRWRMALRWLVLATPLKLFASIGHWLRSFDGLDLKLFHKETYSAVLAGWAGPILFVGFGVPIILGAFGMSGFVSGYLLPWLVFHFWLSTLSLLQHTAPHIPFRAEGEGYDPGRAAICGTVTLRLPRPLEVLLNDSNYALPQLVAPGLPCFHAREAYGYMRERLFPYLTEAALSIKLLTNHITKWQVYDEEKETYVPMDEVQQSVEADIAVIMEEMEKLEAAKKAEAEGLAATSGSEAGVHSGATGGIPGQVGRGAGPAFA